MDVTKIKRMIGQCESTEELHAVIKAAESRITVLRKQGREAEEERVWDRVKNAKPGNYLLCTNDCGLYVYFGRTGNSRVYKHYRRFTRGTLWPVRSVQPRAKRVWVGEDPDMTIAFSPGNLVPIDAFIYPDELRAQVARARLLSIGE